MPPVFASVVEGEGEEAALRPLIHHIITSNNGLVYPKIMPPYRAHWGSLVNTPGELERYAERALRECGPTARLLVLLDADGLCPADLGPSLLRRLASRFPNFPVSVNVADWEYESWFIASAEAIAKHVGSDAIFEVPHNVECIRAAKGWLESNILNRRYRETSDQASFSSVIDVPLARQRSHSFDRFCREVERLLQTSNAG